MLSLGTYLQIELVAGAALALWVIARFPHRGPKSLPAATAVVLVAFVAGHFSANGIPLAATVPFRPYTVLLGYVLPIFFALFVSTGWFLRSLLRLLGGSGGTGHRVRA